MEDVLLVVTLGVAAACLALTALIAIVRFVTARLDARRTRLVAPVRAQLLELVAGDEDEAATALSYLSALPTPVWELSERTVVEFMARLKGAPHAQLVELLRRRGVLAHHIAALTDRRTLRRLRALWVLGIARHRPAALGVSRLLEDPSPEVRLMAVRVLGRIGGPAQLKALLERLAGPDALPWRVTVDAACHVRRGSAPIVIAALQHETGAVRAAAAHLVAAHAIAKGAPRLAELLDDDPDQLVRGQAAVALGQIGSETVALPGLIRASASGDLDVRLAALSGLAALGGARATATLLERCADPNLRICREAARQLVRIGDPARAALESARRDEASPASVHLAWARSELRHGPRRPGVADTAPLGGPTPSAAR